jgi:hypothetical protein
MMKIDVAICKYCNTGVFVRAASDVRSCECGNVEISEDGALVRQGAESYKMEYDVPFKKTEAELEADFNECRDKFGLIRQADKMIARMLDTDRAPVVMTPRKRFEDDVEGMLSLED